MPADRGDNKFAQHAAAVARDLFGEPNKQLSSSDELRFGKQGSMSVDIKTGKFYDHEAKEGGGVLWAIERVTGQTVEGGNAVQWLRDNGYYVEDERRPSGGGSDPGREYKPPRFDPAGNRLPERVPDHGRLTATYDYPDANGKLTIQVCRYEWDVPVEVNPKGHEKTFQQRRPDPSKKDGWSFSVKGVTPVPYRLPELLEDLAQGYEIFIVEGEKKVDILRNLGIPATCNAGGSEKWPDALVEYFRSANVTIIPDNDEAGQRHATLVGNKLSDVGARVRVLNLPGLPPKGSVDDWFPAGGTMERLYELAETAPIFEATAYESKFGAVTWLNFDEPGPVYEELIEGILTENELSLLLGESQSGKSFLAIDIAMAIARGIDWFGHRVRQGGVIYQAGESATGVRRKRFPAYRKHYEVAHENLPVVLLQSPLDLYSGGDEHVEEFIAEANHWKRTFHVPLRLITIDTFNKATPGANENDGKDMGIVLARCDRIRKATGAHVQLVHHLNAGGTKARGHTSLFANVENVILTRIVPDHSDKENRKIREWVLAKQKDGEDGLSEQFVLGQVQIGTKPDGKPLTSCIVAPPAKRAGDGLPDPGGITVGGQNAAILRALYEVMETSGVFAPPELGLPTGTYVVDRKVHATRFYEISRPDNFDELDDEQKDAKRNALRQALSRSRDFLYSKKIIGVKDEWVWLTGKNVKGFGPPPGAAGRRQRRRDEGEEAQAAEKARAALPFNPDDDDMIIF